MFKVRDWAVFTSQVCVLGQNMDCVYALSLHETVMR